MSRTVLEIYKEYNLMPSLVEHMLRVSAVTQMICDSINISVNKESVISAGLIHDIGNVTKIKTGSGLARFYEPEGKEYWDKIADDFIKKYGIDDHHANILVAKELGLSGEVIKLIDSVSIYHILYDNFINSPFEELILNYADNRVSPSPYGVTSIVERQNEARERYRNIQGGMSDEDRNVYQGILLEVEKKIFANCKIKPEDINNESVAPIIENLKDFVIQ